MAEDTGLTAYTTLGADVNKQKTDSPLETKQGVVSQKLPELELDMSDEELVKLTNRWEKAWTESSKKAEWEKVCEQNEKYWLGKHFDKPTADKNRPMVDNIIFEALEIFLPQATSRNPEAVVSLGSGEDDLDPKNQEFVKKVKTKLADLADKNRIRLKIKKAARYWAIFQLGVIKYGWDLDKDIPILRVLRPKKIILDPDATIDEDGYTGNRIGERRKMEAGKLLDIIGTEDDQLDDQGKVKKSGNAKARKAITDLVKDDLGTEIQFIEWWTPRYMCWQLGEDILLKRKNPHWNYDKTVPKTVVDVYGNETPTQEDERGINHFETPRMPYDFLSVYNLGDQPMDNTGLIAQNLSNQDVINKRNKQIDKAVDSMNGGMVVSMERSGLTQVQARGVTEALRKGGTVVIPSGAPKDAVDRFTTQGLPNDVYQELADKRARLRDIFGVTGLSGAGIKGEKTVRGAMMMNSLDTQRVSNGIAEYLEQLADSINNWFLQLLYVYDDDFKFVPGAIPPQIHITVKEGSLLPKDSLTVANQAIQLAKLGRIATIDLFKRLEYPNAEELAANVWLEANAPQILFKNNPQVQEAIQAAQSAANSAKPPSESINYKDLPPEGQAQLAAKVGINIHPDIAGTHMINTEMLKKIHVGGNGSRPPQSLAQ